MKRFFLAFVFCFSAIYTHAQSGYDITINLKNCNDTIAFLTYYQFDKTLIKDTCKLYLIKPQRFLKPLRFVR